MQMPACKVRKHKQIDQGVFQFASCSKEEGQKVFEDLASEVLRGFPTESWGWEGSTADGSRHSRCLVFFAACAGVHLRASDCAIWTQKDGEREDSGWVGFAWEVLVLVWLGEERCRCICLVYKEHLRSFARGQ